MAIAQGTATFSATDTASFTWTAITGSLTNPTPKILALSVTVTDGAGPVDCCCNGAPTNVGGTVMASAPFTGTVTLLGSD